jgi:hypothetical protein
MVTTGLGLVPAETSRRLPAFWSPFLLRLPFGGFFAVPQALELERINSTPNVSRGTSSHFANQFG